MSLEGVRGSILSPTLPHPLPSSSTTQLLPPPGRNRTPSSISSQTTHSVSSISSSSFSSSSSSLPLDIFHPDDHSLDPEVATRELESFRQELDHVQDPDTLRQLILDRERDLRQAALIGLSLTRRHQEMESRLSELAEEGHLPPPEDILPPFPSCSSPPIGHSSILSSSRDGSFEAGSEEWSVHASSSTPPTTIGPSIPSHSDGGSTLPHSPRSHPPDHPQSPRLHAPHPFTLLRAASRSPRYPKTIPSPIASPSPSADTSWNGLGNGDPHPLSPRSSSSRVLGRGGPGRHRYGRRQSVGHGGGPSSSSGPTPGEVDYAEMADLHFRSVNRQNAELRRELEAFREEFQTFRKELSTVNSRIDDLSRDTTELRKKGNADSRRLNDMEGDLAEAAGSVDHLKSQFLLVKDGQRAHVSETKGAVKEVVVGMRKVSGLHGGKGSPPICLNSRDRYFGMKKVHSSIAYLSSSFFSSPHSVSSNSRSTSWRGGSPFPEAIVCGGED